MAHLNAHGNPIIAAPPQDPAAAEAAAGQPLIDKTKYNLAFNQFLQIK